MNTELTDAQRAAIRQMARDSADKDGPLNRVLSASDGVRLASV